MPQVPQSFFLANKGCFLLPHSDMQDCFHFGHLSIRLSFVLLPQAALQYLLLQLPQVADPREKVPKTFRPHRLLFQKSDNHFLCSLASKPPFVGLLWQLFGLLLRVCHIFSTIRLSKDGTLLPVRWLYRFLR